MGSLRTDGRKGTSDRDRETGAIREALDTTRGGRRAGRLSSCGRGRRAGELRVTAEGIRSARGTVLIGLYDSPQTFERAITGQSRDGTPSSRFKMRTGNGTLDKNILGVPAEPYGFSNNAQGFRPSVLR
jgi:uncharacterized protein (DUF2141 family)